MSVSIAESVSSSLHSDHDPLSNIVQLKLKKPKSWNWELSTSKSSPHICFPRILLFDDQNNLLTEANEANYVINGLTGSSQSLIGGKTSAFAKNDNATVSSRRSSSKTSDRSRIINSTELIDCTVESSSPVSVSRSDSDASKHRRCKRSVSTNSCDVTEFLEEFVSDLKRQGIDCKVRRKSSSDRSSQRSHSIRTNGFVEHAGQPKFAEEKASMAETEEANGNVHVVEQSVAQPAEVPIMVYSARGLVQRDLNAKEFDAIRNRDQPYRRSATCNLSEINRNETAVNHANDTAINCASQKLAPGDGGAGKQTNAKVNRSKSGIQKSKSALEVPSTGMGELMNEKRKTRRVHSAKTGNAFDSTSYLERLSYFKRRSSSTDSQALDEYPQFAEVYDASSSKYRLQSSSAGTLVVREESFQNRRVRRRPRKCSNIYEDQDEEGEGEEPVPCPEKVVHKFTYNGDAMNADELCASSDRRTFERSVSPKKKTLGDTYKHNDKFPSRYEKAIESIDCLISKVILSHAEPDLKKVEQMNHDANKCPIGANNPMTDAAIVIAVPDEAHDGNSITGLIKNDRGGTVNARPNENVTGGGGKNTSNTNGTAITNNQNNTSVKQKKCKRKISSSHNNGNVNNWLAPNGSDDNVDCNEKLKSAKKSAGRKIRRSASAGSDRFHLSSSEDDVGINDRHNGRRDRRRTRRPAAATQINEGNNSLDPNGE